LPLIATDGLPHQVLHSLEQAALGASPDGPPPMMRPARSFFSDLRLLELRQCMMAVLELQVLELRCPDCMLIAIDCL
jgi:hypothetical protein